MKVCEKKAEGVCDCSASMYVMSQFSNYWRIQAHSEIRYKTMTEETLSCRLLTHWGDRCCPCTWYLWTEFIKAGFLCPHQIWSRLPVRTRFLWNKELWPAVFARAVKVRFTHFCTLVSQTVRLWPDKVFRVISTEKLSVFPGRTKVFPAQTPYWKRPTVEVCALFELKVRV